ncbi:YraN family protein [Demequina salsinemoris]|uniref:YraN family protein n=1 Tax=Demequina salsinemoris TaxID=577470 RepID=UPI0007834563|nr:YraN family protein [Demequina salsinemoris]
MAAKDAVGRYGEDLVVRRLAERGWVVLARNWRCREGEIDIVATEGDALVVVEVKTRRGASMGAPQEAVTVRKLARLRRLAAAWLAAQDRRWPEVRIDVVAVTLPRAGAARLEHLRAVG